MRRTSLRRLVSAAAALAVAAVISAPAAAQSSRTFVSGHGSDSNNCSISAPCRSFAGAIAQTNAGGEITVLDAAGYGSVTITKAIGIINDGAGEASISAGSGTVGVSISTQAGDIVVLRGLTIEGQGSGKSGIDLTSGGKLEIADTVVRGFTNGIIIEPASNTTIVTIARSSVADNQNAGVYLTPHGSGSVTGTLARLTIDGGNYGAYFDASKSTGPVKVSIEDSTISNSQNTAVTGLGSFPNGSGCAVTMLNTRVLYPQQTGIAVGDITTIYLSHVVQILSGNAQNGVFVGSNTSFSFVQSDGMNLSDGAPNFTGIAVSKWQPY